MLVRALVLTALLLAGCASRGPVVDARGAMPSATSLFRISSLRPEAPPAFERLVAAGLAAQGLREATDGQSAAYSVQVTFSDRALGIGAFMPEATGEPTWRVMAQKRKPLSFRTPKGTYALGVRIVDSVSGQEAYNVRVSRSYRKAAPEADLPVLVTAALAGPEPTKP